MSLEACELCPRRCGKRPGFCGAGDAVRVFRWGPHFGEEPPITGERGSGCICLNGAAARKVQVGDIVIIIAYAYMDFEEAKTFKPTVVFPDSTTNKLK